MKKLLILFAVVVLASCRTVKYLPVETVRTDTVRHVVKERDSIMVMDSIFVNQYLKGDTVYIARDRWRTQWRDRLLIDTLYQVKIDSVAVPYPIEKPLTFLEKARTVLWEGVGMAALLLIVNLFIRSRRE